MFTGLVEARGSVQSNVVGETGSQLSIGVPADFSVNLGDSVAVNGCCLTVASIDASTVQFDINPETLKVTNLAKLKEGSHANLERACKLGSRLGGHLVAGHVDGIALLKSWQPIGESSCLTIELDRKLSRYCIAKGSLCLDGVSLTINAIRDHLETSELDCMLIPVTLRETTFSDLPVGWRLNTEVDQIGKYLERLMDCRS